MVDSLYSEPSLAALYDAICADRDDFAFYLPLVMSAESVLDVGCGTGALLHLAREAGHAGRLCGLDPADAMLDVARARPDVEWVRGDLPPAGRAGEFDLAVMTGHAFQVLLGDDEIRGTLAAVRAALREDGRFAFETRNPSARAWERWTADHVVEVAAPDGGTVRHWTEADGPPVGDLVSFTHTYEGSRWERPRTSRSTLRFLGAREVAAFLTAAGLTVEQTAGDWDGSALTESSPEIIVVARRA